MFLKLFGAMGLTWILELITWIISQYTECVELPIAVSIILIIPNTLQGFIIFLVFAIKPTVRKIIAEKFRSRWSRISVNTVTTTYNKRASRNSIIIRRDPKSRATPPLRNSVSYRPSSDLDFGASDSDPFD